MGARGALKSLSLRVTVMCHAHPLRLGHGSSPWWCGVGRRPGHQAAPGGQRLGQQAPRGNGPGWAPAGSCLPWVPCQGFATHHSAHHHSGHQWPIKGKWQQRYPGWVGERATQRLWPSSPASMRPWAQPAPRAVQPYPDQASALPSCWVHRSDIARGVRVSHKKS